MPRITRPVGSNDSYTNRQLNVMAAGGVYILVQDAQGGPVVCRHQLSTDTSTIETRELSITKVVDFTAKFMRAGLRNFIGRSNWVNDTWFEGSVDEAAIYNTVLSAATVADHYQSGKGS